MNTIYEVKKVLNIHGNDADYFQDSGYLCGER